MDDIDQAQEREALYQAQQLAAQARRAGLDKAGCKECTDCGITIPAKRRRAMPSATRCVDCQEWSERVQKLAKAA